MVLVFVLLAVLIYQIPSVNERLSWRVESAMARVYYFFNRPGRDAFVPAAEAVAQMDVMKTQTASALNRHTDPTEEPTITPTLDSPRPKQLNRLQLLPDALAKIGFWTDAGEYQKANNCVLLIYRVIKILGRKAIRRYRKSVKPFFKDRTVKP